MIGRRQAPPHGMPATGYGFGAESRALPRTAMRYSFGA